MTDRKPKVSELFDLTGKVALITGGARGIGLEIAMGFLEASAEVIVTSRNADRAQKAADELASTAGGKAWALDLDVCSEESVIAAYTKVADRSGKLDILVNNAGGAPRSDNCNVWNRSLADWQAVISTNLTGTFLCTRAASTVMMNQGSGSIINMASISGMIGRDRRMYENIDMPSNLADYAAAKAGVLGFTRDVAAELAPYGVRVNAISPGGMKRSTIPPEFVRRYADATALKRMGDERSDLKGVALLLASDAGAYITGENIVVDGGFTTFK